MTTETTTIAPYRPQRGEPVARMRSLLGQWLQAKRAATMVTYRRDLEGFCSWIAEAVNGGGPRPTVEAAMAWLWGHPAEPLNEIVLAYRSSLVDLGRAPSTINRRMAGLRSFGKMARMIGYARATLEVPNLRVQSYRDTRGIGRAAYHRMLVACEDRIAKGGPRVASETRGLAIARFLHDLGLRRAEVQRLRVRDVNRETQTIYLKGKTGDEPEWPVSQLAWSALLRWLAHHPDPKPDAALFCALRRHAGGALNMATINRIVGRMGADAGIGRVTPHGLRHLAVTTALDEANGNPREVKGFSRHQKIETVMIYDDRRQARSRVLQDKIGEPGKDSTK